MRFSNKRGNTEILLSNTVAIIFHVAFFILLVLVVSRFGSGVNLHEESYAKQIALLIDSAKSGSFIEFDLTNMFALAGDKDFKAVVDINCERNEVFVKMSRNSGYAYQYFSELKDCDYIVDREAMKLRIAVR